MTKAATFFRSSLAAIITIAFVSVVALIFLLQDNLSKFLIKPSEPFQVQTPPVSPSYGGRGAWAVWPDRASDHPVDIFYVHSTTHADRNRWNGPIGDPQSDAVLRAIAIPNEAGPFLDAGRVYGPRYRQATLFAEFTHKFDGLAAHELAFQDISNAFQHFQANRGAGRPFILVGYGQGALMAMGLLQDAIFTEAELQSQLVAAYLINISVPQALTSSTGAPISACESESDTGCVVAFTALQPPLKRDSYRYRARALIWTKDRRLQSVSRPPLRCTNPISWNNDGEYAGAAAHLGAASATGLRPGEQPPAIKNAIGARCDAGILFVDPPQQRFLRTGRWFGTQWRPRAYNLFYYDLMVDAQRRAQAHVRLVKQRPD